MPKNRQRRHPKKTDRTRGAETKGFFWRIAPAGGGRADNEITETAEIRKAEAKPNALQMQFNNLSKCTRCKTKEIREKQGKQNITSSLSELLLFRCIEV